MEARFDAMTNESQETQSASPEAARMAGVELEPLEQARRFAEMLTQSPVWAEWVSAQEAFQNDPEAQGLVQEYQQVLMEIEQELQPGEHYLNEEQVARIKQAEEKLRANPVIQRREEAIRGVIGYFVSFNTALTGLLGMDLLRLAGVNYHECCGGDNCDCKE